MEILIHSLLDIHLATYALQMNLKSGLTNYVFQMNLIRDFWDHSLNLMPVMI